MSKNKIFNFIIILLLIVIAITIIMIIIKYGRNQVNEKHLSAVVDEFEYKKQHYVAAAVINDDMINEDELYIYRSILSEDDFSVEQITDLKEYEEIANAYLDMQ